MGWFGRKAAEPPAVFLSCLDENRNPFPSGYQAQVREVFLANPVGQRAVRLVAGAVSSLKIYALEGDEQAAALLDRTNLLEQVTASLLLHGNAFLQIVEALGAPAELFHLQPERVTVEADEQGWPRAYQYKAGRRTTRIERKDLLERVQLVHIRALNRCRSRLGWAALRRRVRRRRSTIGRAGGTRHCSTMRRGRRERSTTSRPMARR
jgi:phage portal protein BeeE